MEATHLGALFSSLSDEECRVALSHLGKSPLLPAGLSKIVDEKGVPNMDLVAKAHAWLCAAVEVWSSVKTVGTSLGGAYVALWPRAIFTLCNRHFQILSEQHSRRRAYLVRISWNYLRSGQGGHDPRDLPECTTH